MSEAFEEVVFLIDDHGLATTVRDLVMSEQVPVYLYPDLREVAGRQWHALAVPPEFYRAARIVIRTRLDELTFVRLGEHEALVSSAGQESPAEPASAQVHPELEELAERGEEAIPDLIRCILGEDEGVATQASTLLRTHGSTALSHLEDRLSRAVEARESREVGLLVAACSMVGSIPSSFLHLFSHVDPALRSVAFRLAADLRLAPGLSALSAGLEDDESSVREEAAELLFSFAGTDFGFDPEVAPSRNRRSLRLVREWLEKDSGFPGDPPSS